MGENTAGALITCVTAPSPRLYRNTALVMLCYVMLCYVMLCYVMLCYTLSLGFAEV